MESMRFEFMYLHERQRLGPKHIPVLTSAIAFRQMHRACMPPSNHALSPATGRTLRNCLKVSTAARRWCRYLLHEIPRSPSNSRSQRRLEQRLCMQVTAGDFAMVQDEASQMGIEIETVTDVQHDFVAFKGTQSAYDQRLWV